MEYLVGLSFVCGVIAAIIASRKGQGCGGFLAGVIFGPLGLSSR